MGGTAPSLYTAFGNKQRLFLEAAHRYFGDPAANALAIDEAPTAYEAARALLTGAAITYTGDTTPRGCLLASATASGSAASSEVQAAIAAFRNGVHERLRLRIERDIASGLLPAPTDAAALAGLVLTIIQGLSVMARDGMPRAALLNIVNVALHVWPKPPETPSA